MHLPIPTNRKSDFPAFPFPGFLGAGSHPARPGNSGMSFRDHLAVQAMGNIILHEDYHPESPSRIALQSYSIADAMLEAREK